MNKEIIKITQSAYKKLALIAKENNNKNILFSVRGGGCNGYNYMLEPMDFKPDKHIEKVVRDDFTLFICDHSIMHVWDTTRDWKKDIMGQTFTFKNPMAQSSCGCGTSFSSKANMK